MKTPILTFWFISVIDFLGIAACVNIISAFGPFTISRNMLDDNTDPKKIHWTGVRLQIKTDAFCCFVEKDKTEVE